MASFLRGKQTGMQNDLSAGITPDSFAPDDQARFGINSQIRYAPSKLDSNLPLPPLCEMYRWIE
jgi:hypothetical protein